MADLTKVTGVADEDISKVDGVAAASISKVSGVTKSAGTLTATKWLVGAQSGKVFKSAESDGGSGWSQIVDLGGGNGKGITIGKDDAGNKRWVLHRDVNAEEISYVNDGLEEDIANWTEINLSLIHI